MSLSEAKKELFGLCEHMSDEAYTALEKPDLNLTAKGFWRGQKSAAKAISRAMGDVFRDLDSRQEGSAGDDGAAMRHTLSVQATDKPLQAEGAPAAKIANAYYEGAMAALGCDWWGDGPDFFALVGQDYAAGKPLPATMPKRREGAPAAEGDIDWLVFTREYVGAERYARDYEYCDAQIRPALKRAYQAALSPPAAEGKENAINWLEVADARAAIIQDLAARYTLARMTIENAAAKLGRFGSQDDALSGLRETMHALRTGDIEVVRTVDALDSIDPTPAPAAEPVEGILVGLDSIRRQADYWVKYNTEARAREGLTSDDDTHLISPPWWPSHGQLKAWSATLTKAVDALSKLSGYPLGEGKQGVMASSAGVCGEGTLPSPSVPPRSAGGEG